MFVSIIEPIAKTKANKPKFYCKSKKLKDENKAPAPLGSNKTSQPQNHTALCPQTYFDIALLSSESKQHF